MSVQRTDEEFERIRDSRLDLAEALHGLLMRICINAPDRIPASSEEVRAAQAVLKRVTEETFL